MIDAIVFAGLLPPAQQRGDEDADGPEQASQRAAKAPVPFGVSHQPAEQREQQRAGDDEGIPPVIHTRRILAQGLDVACRGLACQYPAKWSPHRVGRANQPGSF